jgi:hypothetical protein
LTDAFGWKEEDLGNQQDIAELNRKFTEAIDDVLAPTDKAGLAADFFVGTQ